jgi:hypothetical protein
VIVAIDGRPALVTPLWQVREGFQKEGTTYVLRIKRGEMELEKPLKTRRLV